MTNIFVYITSPLYLIGKGWCVVVVVFVFVCFFVVVFFFFWGGGGGLKDFFPTQILLIHLSAHKHHLNVLYCKIVKEAINLKAP